MGEQETPPQLGELSDEEKRTLLMIVTDREQWEEEVRESRRLKFAKWLYEHGIINEDC